MFGAIDARRLFFNVRQSIVDPQSAWTYYSLRNLRSGEEWIKRFDESFVHELYLDPGEGTLLRIGPVQSLPLGKTMDAGMAYNNGHREAALRDNWKVVTWQTKVGEGAKVQYAFVRATSASNAATISSAVSAITLDNGLNPSVATKLSSDPLCDYDTVCIVYNYIPDVGHNRAVQARLIPVLKSDPRTTLPAVGFATGVQLPPVPELSTHLVTATVSPSMEGFMCAYAQPVGIQVDLLYMHGASPSTKALDHLSLPALVMSPEIGTLKGFPTIATSDDQSSGLIPAAKEYLHVAWQEEFADANGTSHIYYQRFDRPLASDWNHAIPQAVERVSKGAPTCINKHPNLCLYGQLPIPGVAPKPSEPAVTWEMYQRDAGCPDHLSYQLAGTTYALFRYRSTGAWQSISALHPKRWNLPLPLVQVLPGGLANFCVILQDTLSSLMHRYEYHAGIWSEAIMPERGREPSNVLPWPDILVGPAPSLVWAHSFRGSDRDESGLFAARINLLDNDARPVVKTSVPILQVGKQHDCEKGLVLSITRGSVGCPDCNDPTSEYPDSTARRSITWKPYERFSDSSEYRDVGGPTWYRTEDSIRSENFSFVPGESININAVTTIADSTWIATTFTDSNANLKIELQLKDSATSELLGTLGSVQVWGHPPIGQVPIEMTPIPFDCIERGVGSSGGMKVSKAQQIKWPVPLTIGPSRKGYLTLKVTKDPLTNVDLWHANKDEEVIEVLDTTTIGYKPTPARAREEASFVLTAHPNPFNPTTDISIDLTKNVQTRVDVFSITGVLVRTLYNDLPTTSEVKRLRFEANGIGSGTYIVRATQGNSVKSIRIALKK
jgi:hypothetical protein